MNTFGEKLKFTVFGESHGFGVGMMLDGIPQGLQIDFDALNAEMARRAPGGSEKDADDGTDASNNPETHDNLGFAPADSF